MGDYSSWLAIFSKIGYLVWRLLIAVPLKNENVQEIWAIKMKFGWPNIEIGRNMANGRLLFLALRLAITHHS